MVKVRPAALPDVLIIEPKILRDARGAFFESWHAHRYADLGISGRFVQDNVSQSRRGVLRGMHFQNPDAQGKLVQVLDGEVYDVAVDIRRDSPTYTQWVGVQLSSENGLQMWIPEGFAHGFCVTSESATFAYKCTNYYEPKSEHTVRWDDPDIGIDWPIARPELSAKDRDAPLLKDLAPVWLPQYQEI